MQSNITLQVFWLQMQPLNYDEPSMYIRDTGKGSNFKYVLPAQLQ